MLTKTKTTSSSIQIKRLAISKKLWFFVLEGIFFTGIIGIALINEVPLTFSPWFIFLFVLATFRAARTLSFNEIAAGLREPFTFTKKDSCGAGDNVHAKPGGLRYVIGSLLACPICTGTWCALMLVALYVIYQPVGTVLVYVLALAGGSELVHYIAEYFEWGARLNRVQAGKISPDEG